MSDGNEDSQAAMWAEDDLPTLEQEHSWNLPEPERETCFQLGNRDQLAFRLSVPE